MLYSTCPNLLGPGTTEYPTLRKNKLKIVIYSTRFAFVNQVLFLFSTSKSNETNDTYKATYIRSALYIVVF